MLISKIALDSNVDTFQIINEKSFNCFSRITSNVSYPCCVFLSDAKYVKKISSFVSMVITTKDIFAQLGERPFGVCIVDSPKPFFWNLVNYINLQINETIADGHISETAVVSPWAYIEKGVTIGDFTTVEPFACIYQNTVIGKNCKIRSGAKIGVQDYNFFKYHDNMTQVVHAGKTILGNNVSAGCNSVIGRSVFDYNQTIIDDNSIIGSCCSIGHDCHLGKSTKVGANSVIGGYTTIGDNTEIAIGVTVKNALSVGCQARIDMGSVVIINVCDGKVVFGNPAKKTIS